MDFLPRLKIKLLSMLLIPVLCIGFATGIPTYKQPTAQPANYYPAPTGSIRSKPEPTPFFVPQYSGPYLIPQLPRQEGKRYYAPEYTEESKKIIKNFIPNISYPKTPPAIGNTFSNFLNGGYAVQQEDWIYYSTLTQLVKMKQDNSESHVLYEGHYIKYLNIYDDWIFFQDDYMIYRINTDGSNVMVFTEGEQPFLYDNAIFYIKMDTDINTEFLHYTTFTGEEKSSQLDKNFEIYTIIGDCIISQGKNNNTIKYMKISGSGKSTAFTGNRESLLSALMEGHLYTGSVYNFYYDKKHFLREDAIENKNICDDWLYFSEKIESYDRIIHIYKARPDNSEKTLLFEHNWYFSSAFNPTGICIAGDWLFYMDCTMNFNIINTKTRLTTYP